MSENTSHSTGKRWLIRFLKLILVAIIFYFVYRQFSKHWSEVVNYEWTINYGLLLLSVILHLVTFILFSKVWCFLIEAFGFKVKLRHAFKIGYITNLGRYIPGKVWPVLGMSYLARQINISEENSVVSWIVALIFTLPSAFLASLVCILMSPEIFSNGLSVYLDWTIYVTAAVVFIISILLIIIPNKFFAIINIILRKLNRQIIDLKISFKTALLVYFGYFFCWLVYGLSFWVLLISISNNSEVPVIPSIGAFIIAYQLGYLAFFAPGGIGVREIVLTTILFPYLGPIAAGISIAARIWNMITEIIAATIAYFIKFPKKEL